ncbi:permease prefix domain 1-containing protein [Aquibacillus rhizosphaerae]|uniref:Permease prefix domain 1-containing protein n=1 Tax=Aquibacillus rhizosphaerae TaxID=3051431 RepID=A0ABT7L7E4_9BACI|nr:permease prefix domain 1-containing protein [Aquibacillus sp. LR5S19]MDL4841782.1 permease prefix domain 1-containing protein [Aquibacillus sp. LR5S19]
METINNYLENMFASLPNTEEMRKLKEELLSNMEEKYHELKRDGKTENEAIGIVISEFGNIDELIHEFDIPVDKNEEELPTIITDKEVNNYLEASEKFGKVIGIGVFMCIIASAQLVLISQLVEDNVIVGVSEQAGSIIGLVPFFILIAIAVGLFIYSGMKMEKYKYIEDGVEVTSNTKTYLRQKNEAFQSTFTISLIIGVALCILSPIILFITSIYSDGASVYGVVALLCMVAVAVYIFVYYGTIRDSYKKLLRIDEFSKYKQEENRIIGAVASIIWPLAVVIFLISGLVFNQWHINWIVFPITGLLFAMFSGAYSILKEKH